MGNKMTNWKAANRDGWDKDTNMTNIGGWQVLDAENKPVVIAWSNEYDTKEQMNKIASAANSTYGQGIRPESVPELYRTLKNLCEYFEWLIKDPAFPSYIEAKEALAKSKI